ncbi:MAG: type II toxin-antitoxin system Phd/YefM family antitoxin [Egibacteraceae bacterium]
MDSVGVRDLKQNASRVLARVKAGETVEVTRAGSADRASRPPGTDRRV